ncbi:Ulp1 family isopeptidase [Mesorhizobium sp. Cs1299R1N1]|uniref:Ulp1 family isopeptidase n=1 Tax=Mesorhizobium sp. Cs1299R1N1 TaxID=3015172 RepID=UPI00301C32A6
MDANYNDPDYWTRWYAEQKELQRARQGSDNMAADQAVFEQQLSELQLSSSEESSAKLSSPGTRPAEAQRSLRRTGIGGSMRMPQQSNLRDSGFSSTRHSIDIPRAHLGSAPTGSQSDLRDRSFGSTRFTAPSEAQTATRTKDSKSRGLFSRVKSGLGKVFGSRSEKSSRSPVSDVVHSELRMDSAKRSRPPTGADMHPADERLIEQFAAELRAYEVVPDGTIGRGEGKVPEPTIKDNLGVLRGFARWLRQENRGPLTTRAFNEPRSLAIDIEDYTKAGGDDRDRLSSALSHFRRLGAEGLQSVGAGPRLMGRQTLGPYPEDALVIDGLEKKNLAELAPDSTRPQKTRVSVIASRQRKFSDWLQREGKGSIVSRLNGSAQEQLSLQADHKAFITATGQTSSQLDQLRQYLGADPQINRHSPYPDDASIIDGLEKEELRQLGPEVGKQRKVVWNTAWAQRRFSDWLQREGRGSIAGRLNGTAQQKLSLKADQKAFNTAYGKTALSLDRLQQHLGGGIQTSRQSNRHNPYPDDARIIEGLAKEELIKLGPRPTSRQKNVSVTIASAQRRFSDWLQREGRASIVSRLNGTAQQKLSLKADHKDFTNAEGKVTLSLNRLRQYLAVVEANRALGVASSEQVDWAPQPAGSSSTWSPYVPSDFDANEWLPEGQSGHSERQEAASSGSSWPRVPSDFDAREWLPEGALGHAERQETASSGSSWPPRVPSDFDANEWLPEGQLEQAEWQDDAYYRPELPVTPSVAHIDALDPGASSHARTGQVLGAEQWLGDEHIQRDYDLLAQELPVTYPNLAARTRFVDPLIALYSLRGGIDMQRALDGILYRDGNDTADFVFVPVSDASTTDPNRRGTHWSLLLVDRRDRESPVAYHYDSVRGHNDVPASVVAARLGARLEPARMSQQQNDYDCGVFVVDGTRALVGQLAQERLPVQQSRHLDNLVADRQALQNRLGGRLMHELPPDRGELELAGVGNSRDLRGSRDLDTGRYAERTRDRSQGLGR